MRTNIKINDNRQRTHEGAIVANIAAESQLVRSVLANMLWEGEFYEDGETNAKRIARLVAQVSPSYVGNLAERTRSDFKLRHIPLLLMRELARIGQLRAEQLTNVIQRPDEIGEFLSIYWKDGKCPISNQVKKGLANAFHKFNEFQLSKWDKNSAAISLRDVMFLVHPNPGKREALFKRIANQEMGIADTWETRLSAGADKKETFSELMAESRLGALAFLRNLRNMVQSGISEKEIREYARKVNVEKVLPFRYIAAAKIVPQFEDMLEEMMLRSLASHEKLRGRTVLLVDVSISMFGTRISDKSDLDRFDAAAALAMLCREICEDVVIYTFSNRAVRVAPRSGFALRETLSNSQFHSGTRLGSALAEIHQNEKYDRIIVFTDEQSRDAVTTKPRGKGYILNVASYQNGINHADWLTISGFSEAVIDFIQTYESV
jgi:60 kDa SS-A/Ro ribonucleoprotein